jgi:phosphoribosyl-ATP pyrophosphohydrolase/phosphoribosyl-AMP cyclohydrolase
MWTKAKRAEIFSQSKNFSSMRRRSHLIKAKPAGAVCHTGTDTVFGKRIFPQNAGRQRQTKIELEEVIKNRRKILGRLYTASLWRKALTKSRRKVGEEAVELVISKPKTMKRVI